MKVLLIEDVAHVGRKGEVAEVADGYGINFLIPSRKALKADSPEALSLITKLQSDAQNKSKDQEQIIAVLKDLQGVQFNLPVEANESGTLFGKLDNSKVAEMISSITQKEVSAKSVNLPDGEIKELGEYNVELKSGDEVLATAMLNVTTDKV